MKKQYKRFVAFFLTWIMCISMLQGIVWAEDTVLLEDDFYLTEETETVNRTDRLDTLEEVIAAEEEGSRENEDASSETLIEDEDIITEEAGAIMQDADGIIYEEGSEQEQSVFPEENQILTEIYINPLYRDVISEEDLKKPDPYGISVLADDVEYVDLENAAVSFRTQMKQRAETITIKVMTEDVADGDVRVVAQTVARAAMVHTGNPTEGDYLKWQYSGWQCNISYSRNSVYYITLTYTLTYYTTADQEAELDSAIASLKSELELTDESKTKYEKVKAIYEYITQNITYDYVNLNDSAYLLKYTAYAALIKGTAVCQGYAVLFYRMALECGIDARLISGQGNGGAHGWNIVNLGNWYYNLDATWDASYYKTHYTYNYFLKNAANFGDHIRDTDYDTEEFHALYPMTETDYSEAHTHSYGEWITTLEPTCTGAGLQKKSCTVCGNEQTEDIPATGHTEVADTAVEPTCTESGLTAGSHCSVCGEVLNEQTVVPATGHTAVTDAAVTATCTETGLTEGSHCSVCGTVLTVQEIIPATGHTEVSDAAVAPTCTESGLTAGSHCSACGEVLEAQTVVPALGHTEVSDAAIAPTCTETGLTEGKHCSVCGIVLEAQTVVPATGHTEVSDAAVEPTCTESGLTAGSHCSVCGEVLTGCDVVPATGHTVITDQAVEATCTTSGLTEGSHCSVCGEILVKQEVIPAGHLYGDWTVEKEATCTEEGSKVRICTKCGEEQTQIIDRKAHTVVMDAAVAAACATTGLTAGSHCSVCGTVLKKQEVIPALGHTVVTDVAVAAACATTGLTAGSHCSVCGEILQKQNVIAVDPEKHSWSAWKKISEATVFAAERQERSCALCGASEIRTAGSVLVSVPKMNVKSVLLKVSQSTAKVTVSGLANGDSIVSWSSSNTAIVKVGRKTGKLTAQKKTGTATVTVKLASGKTASVKVTVQKEAVKTTKISGLTSKITLKKGSKITLKPVITPITSLEKITYKTSNKTVATVSSKGVITAKAAGTAKITVTSGKKKFIVTVSVPKVATEKITNVKAAVTIKKGKSYTLKPKLSPTNSDDKITYTSSNKKVATVDSKGKITGKKKGTATITIKAGKKKVTCKVTVK